MAPPHVQTHLDGPAMKLLEAHATKSAYRLRLHHDSMVCGGVREPCAVYHTKSSPSSSAAFVTSSRTVVGPLFRKNRVFFFGKTRPRPAPPPVFPGALWGPHAGRAPEGSWVEPRCLLAGEAIACAEVFARKAGGDDGYRVSAIVWVDFAATQYRSRAQSRRQ